MGPDTLLLPKELNAAQTYVLRDEIPALQLVATENGHARWGPLVRLPRGAHLDDFGEGFDARTLLRFNTSFFVIFRQDLLASQQLHSRRNRSRPQKN